MSVGCQGIPWKKRGKIHQKKRNNIIMGIKRNNKFMNNSLSYQLVA